MINNFGHSFTVSEHFLRLPQLLLDGVGHHAQGGRHGGARHPVDQEPDHLGPVDYGPIRGDI